MIGTDHTLPPVKELQKRLARAEAEKAAEDARHESAAEAEKKALLEQLAKPSGVSDDEQPRDLAQDK